MVGSRISCRGPCKTGRFRFRTCALDKTEVHRLVTEPLREKQENTRYMFPLSRFKYPGLLSVSFRAISVEHGSHVVMVEYRINLVPNVSFSHKISPKKLAHTSMQKCCFVGGIAKYSPYALPVLCAPSHTPMFLRQPPKGCQIPR